VIAAVAVSSTRFRRTHVNKGQSIALSIKPRPDSGRARLTD